MLAGFPLSRPAAATSPGPMVGDWSMAKQVSTDGVLIDYSGNGHHGYYGGVKRAFIGDTTTGVRAWHCWNVANNTVTLAGLANSTTYDMTITYHDNTTTTHELASSGTGVMTFAPATDAKFTNLFVKTIVIVPDGGGATVDTVDFTAQAQGTRSFTTGGGRTVTVNQSADTAAMPTLLWWTGTTYGWLPGTSGNFASVPDAANLRQTGDQTIEMLVYHANWTPGASQGLFSRDNPDTLNRGIRLNLRSTQGLQIQYSTNGSSFEASVNANANLPWTGTAAERWIRARIDSDNGAGGSDFVFEWAPDNNGTPGSWTAIGTTVTVGSTISIYAAQVATAIFSERSNGTAGLVSGHVKKVRYYSDFSATTKVLDIDFTALASYNATQTALTAVTGQAVTINRSATGLKSTVVDRNKCVSDGVDDYISVDDHARLDVDSAGNLTLAAVARIHGTPAAEQVLIGKKSGVAAANAGYQMTLGTSRELIGRVTDGTDEAESTTAALTASGKTVCAMTLKRAGNVDRAYANGVSATPADASAVGDLSNAIEFRIFTGGAGANFCAGELESAKLYNRPLSASQLLRLNSEP